MTPTIETPRIWLRGWRDDDIEPWIRLNADPVAMEFFPRTYTPEESRAGAALLRDKLARDGYGWFVAEVKDKFPFAGVIALAEVPFEAPFTPAFEVGWRFLPETWGQGYATEGARAAVDFAFESLGFSELVAMTATTNLRSQRVMQKLGMTHAPEDDFDHPRLPPGHPLQRHVLYRIRKP